MTLQEVERIVQQLEPGDRLKLAAGICKQLSGQQANLETERASRRERMLAALDRMDEIAGSIDGEFDSAEDLRRIREERIAQIGG